MLGVRLVRQGTQGCSFLTFSDLFKDTRKNAPLYSFSYNMLLFMTFRPFLPQKKFRSVFRSEMRHSGAFQIIEIQNFLRPWWRYSLINVLKCFILEHFRSSESKIFVINVWKCLILELKIIDIQNFLQPLWRYLSWETDEHLEAPVWRLWYVFWIL